MNKEEYIKKLKEKALIGHQMFLFDPLKPTIFDEIEKNKDELWNV